MGDMTAVACHFGSGSQPPPVPYLLHAYGTCCLLWCCLTVCGPVDEGINATAANASGWRAGALCAVLWGQGVLGTLTPEFFQRAVAQLENKGLGEFEPQVG